MKRAFSLIEVLVVVAIIAIMVAAAVTNVEAGKDAARLKAASRAIFATIRHARSVALVTQQPAIITYSVERKGEEPCAKVEITSAKLLAADENAVAMTLEGKRVSLAGEGEEQSASAKRTKGKSEDEGPSRQRLRTTEEVLFSPIRAEVVKGVRVKVLREGERLAGGFAEERSDPKISVFSNVDSLIRRFRAQRDAEAEVKADSADGKEKKSKKGEAEVKPEPEDEPVSIVWEVNGRTEPHRVFVYADGESPESGLVVNVDRFGAIKVDESSAVQVTVGDER